MKVFLSYGSVSDQVTALRLQALAAVNGLTVYVPPIYTRHSDAVLLDPGSEQKLKEVDVVLAIVGSGVTESCRQELNTALAFAKPTIVMAEPVFAKALKPHFGANIVVMDPANPERAERGIVQHVKNIDAEESTKNALLALGTIALGLLIFAPQD